MTAGLADRLDLAPELRMASYAFGESFGFQPRVVWRVPGSVTLLADGLSRLTVATPWGAIAAAAPRSGDVIDVARMERPGQRERRPAGARGGAALLVSSELPSGAGVGADAAVGTAIRLCLGEETPGADSANGAGPAGRAGLANGAGPVGGVRGAALDGVDGGLVTLDGRRLPLDLAGAGLRLMVIDTRVRDIPLAEPAGDPTADAATAAIENGDMRGLGQLLTAAHRGLDCHEAQHIAVTMALRAGALGARAIIDGPGRPACALVPVERLGDVRTAVSGQFARRRLRAPRFLTFTPAGGPRGIGLG